MSKFNNFFTNHGIKIIIVIIVLTYFKSCSIDSEVERIKKELTIEHESTAQIKESIKNLPTSTDIIIEGLKAESRMIQGTDRKMLDVQRQNEIERLINELEK
jgi:galactitol-specific phosphotransferase system IIB component